MKKRLTAAAAVMALSGCASIVGDSTQVFKFNSNPSGATVDVTDKSGTKVFRGTTPTTATLPKSAGYFRGETYTATFSKKGYEPQMATMDSHPGGWYVIGNLFFGGLTGWLIVDPLTGAMWSFDPDGATVALTETKTELGTQRQEATTPTTVHATTAPVPSPVVATVAAAPTGLRGGQDSLEVERFAKAQACVPVGSPSMFAKGPGYESYTVACSTGEALAVRCDFGNCRGLK